MPIRGVTSLRSSSVPAEAVPTFPATVARQPQPPSRPRNHQLSRTACYPRLRTASFPLTMGSERMANHDPGSNTGADLQPLMADMSNQDPSRRAAAATELGKLKLVRTAKSLVRHLEDSDAHVRASVTWALVQIGAGAVDRIVDSLAHLHNDGRAVAFGALGMIGSPRALAPLMAFLKQATLGYAPSFHLREATRAALDALARILAASAGQCAEDDLRALAVLADVTEQKMVGDDEQTRREHKIGDCAAIRSLADAELRRRGIANARACDT